MAKRLTCFLLSLVLILSTSITSFADSPGGGGSNHQVTPHSTSPGYKADNAIFNDYGFRVTVSTVNALKEEGIQPLSGDYTLGDLDNAYNEIRDVTRHRYYAPGNGGLYFQRGLNGNLGTVKYAISSYYPGDGYVIPGGAKRMRESTVTANDNQLAWMIYEGVEGTQWPAGLAYNKELASIIQGANTNYANADDWFYDVRQKYIAAGGNNNVKELILNLVSNGNYTVENFNQFSWSTTEAWTGTAQQKVYWSKTGYIAMLIYWTWYCQDIGDMTMYQYFRDAMWSWISSDYAFEAMPILEVEACHVIGLDGNPNNWSPGNIALVNIPYTIANSYEPGIVPLLYSNWGEEYENNMLAFLSSATAQYGLRTAKRLVSQGFGYYFSQGVPIQKDADRAFFKTLYPNDISDNNYGYFISFTYPTDGWTTTITTDPGSPNANGSFTWDLDPKGHHDLTPASEVKKSSNIEKLNISQYGHNMNNYTKWEERVRGDGVDENCIRISIYHVSDSFDNEGTGPNYTRGQIKSKGKPVNGDPVDRITNGNGEITNVPVIGTLVNGESYCGLTDDQFLEILKNGTDLMYTETIEGSCRQPVDTR